MGTTAGPNLAMPVMPAADAVGNTQRPHVCVCAPQLTVIDGSWSIAHPRWCGKQSFCKVLHWKVQSIHEMGRREIA